VGSRVESCTCAKQIRVSWLSHKFGLIEVNKSVLCGFKNKVNIPVLCRSGISAQTESLSTSGIERLH
nr:hypothetical protein [Aulosira sp. DedVER01a]